MLLLCCIMGNEVILADFNDQILSSFNSYPAEFPELMVLECAAKQSLGCLSGSPGLVWQNIQEPLTADRMARYRQL